jgi:hypothetical protein
MGKPKYKEDMVPSKEVRDRKREKNDTTEECYPIMGSLKTLSVAKRT